MAHSVTDYPRKLPVAVPLVRDETSRSYLSRLARANHLHPDKLARYLDLHEPHRSERLAVITGHSVERLRTMLANTDRLDSRQERHACRRCTARRGIHAPVRIAAPTYLCVCLRHQRWLPEDGATHQQYDLRELPEMLTAQRHHLRLARQHGIVNTARLVDDAKRITQGWTRRREWGQHRNRRLRCLLDPDKWWIHEEHPLMIMANYPETIALARLLATPRWTQPAISEDPDTVAGFYAEVSRRLNLTYWPGGGTDPLQLWRQRSRASA